MNRTKNINDKQSSNCMDDCVRNVQMMYEEPICMCSIYGVCTIMLNMVDVIKLRIVGD